MKHYQPMCLNRRLLHICKLFNVLKKSLPVIRVILCAFFASISYAQESSEPLAQLKGNISNVSLKGVVYNQSLQEKNGSCIVSIKVLNTDKQKEEEYEFNFSDLNEYKVNLNVTKRSLKVVCETKGGKKIIRVYENGKVKGYSNKFAFYAFDLDNGKLLVEELKKQIKPCEAYQKDLSIILGGSPDINKAIEFLKTNIKKVSVNEHVWDQHFSADESFKALCNLDITIQKDEKNIIYKLNAADINSSTIDFNTKNEFVMVSGQTKGNKKFIEVFENGEKTNYTGKFVIYAEDIEHARKLKSVLELYVKESEELKSRELDKLDNVNSLVDIVDFFKARFKDVVVGEKSFKQLFSYENSQPFLTTFNVDKGGSESWMLNLVDLDENSVSFNTKGNELRIEMQTSGRLNRVKYTIGGETGKYTNKIVIWASDIEEARVLLEALKKMITKAKEIYKPFLVDGVENPTKAQCLTYLKGAFTEVVIGDNAYKLELEEDESDKCKLIYEEHDVTKDKTSHYKFNMLDINNYKIKFNAKGQEALVYLEIKGEKKFIEISEQGTAKGYDYKLNLKAQDIERARLIAEAFKKLSEHCAESNK